MVDRRARSSSAGPAGGAAGPSIEVVYALPDQQSVVTLPLPPEGLNALQAVQDSGLLDLFPEILERPLVLGIYGAVCQPKQRLRDGDRVEVYRPLQADPRASRRERVANEPRKGWKRRGRTDSGPAAT